MERSDEFVSVVQPGKIDANVENLNSSSLRLLAQQRWCLSQVSPLYAECDQLGQGRLSSMNSRGGELVQGHR